MKTFWIWTFGLALAALPLAGKGQDAVTDPAAAITNASSPEVAEQALENAPGKIVSTPSGTPAHVTVSDTAAEIIKLAQAGVDESVMLTFVSNSASLFNLNSDQIVYLNDIGVPSTVVTAMIQRDQVLKVNNPALAATAVTTETPPADTAAVTATAEAVPDATAAVPTVNAPLTPPPSVQAPVNVSYTYFYDSLAPYGNWVDIQGYGLCWQPTVVVLNPGWQPYGDRGRWIYSDHGWYWASDYTWGWAPFHYGRWFRHSRWGWCWAPDTVWGPSWVTWRYTDDYCGWAPLPPTACYSPGIGFTYYGRSVGFNFSFGLSVGWFTFVHTRNFCDPHPWRHRVPRQRVTQVFHNTTIVNQVVVNNNRIVNRGIPVEHVSRATRSEIRPVRVNDTEDFGRVRRGERVERDGRTLTVYRPSLPQPSPNRRLVGEGVQPASLRDVSSRRIGMIPTANTTTSAPDQVGGGATDTRVRDRGSRQRGATEPAVRTPGRNQSADDAPNTPVVGNQQVDPAQTPSAANSTADANVRRPGRTPSEPNRPASRRGGNAPDAPTVGSQPVAPAQTPTDSTPATGANVRRPDRAQGEPNQPPGRRGGNMPNAPTLGNQQVVPNQPPTAPNPTVDGNVNRPGRRQSEPNQPLILRGENRATRPGNERILQQPSAPAAPTAPTTPEPVRRSGLNRPQPMPAPQSPAATPQVRPSAPPVVTPPVTPNRGEQQNQRAFRQEQSRPMPSAPSVQPTAPPVQRPAAPSYQPPPAREQRSWGGHNSQGNAPSVPPVYRQAPPAPSYQPPPSAPPQYNSPSRNSQPAPSQGGRPDRGQNDDRNPRGRR